MSSQYDIPLIEPDAPEIAEAILAAYLDALCRPLSGIVPSDEWLRLREETEVHLERLANAFALEGMSPIQAAHCAIDRYGPASQIAQQYLDVWQAYSPSGKLSRCLGAGAVTATLWFGLFTLAATLLLLGQVYWPDMSPMETIGLTQTLHRFFPASLLAIAGNQSIFPLCFLLLIAPVLAGWMTGCQILVRSVRAVCQAQIVCTLYAFVLGLTLLPMRDGFALAALQLLYWLPAGCVSAHLASKATIQWRYRSLLAEEKKVQS